MINKMKISLEDIQKAHQLIQPHIRKTEVDKSISASKILQSEVYFKYENTQFTGSFKIRGALNKISQLSQIEKNNGVVASSAGNHAQGVALSASKAGVKAKIVMPIHAPLIKIQATKDYGAEVILHGEIYDEAYEKARELEKEFQHTFVHPYEDPLIIAGQGTIGLELFKDISDLSSVIIPVGGGGLISGVATALKTLNPKIKIFGVQSSLSPGMERLFHHKNSEAPKRSISTIADGIAIKRPSPLMYESFISNLVDDMVTVTDDEIAEALVFLIERAKTVCEGSGAVGVAALMNRKMDVGAKTCVLLSGGNIDLNLISKVLEKGLIRKGRLFELSVIVDDIPGNLSRMTKAIADLGANILQVHHDRTSQGLFLRETRIDFLLETTSLDHVQQIKEALIKAGGRI